MEDDSHEVSVQRIPSIEHPKPSTGHEFPSIIDRSENDGVVSELECLRMSNRELQSRCTGMEETIEVLRCGNLELSKALEEASHEHESLRFRILKAEASAEEREEENLREKLALVNEIEVTRGKISEFLEERSKRDSIFSEFLTAVRTVKECLSSIAEKIDDEEKLESCAEGEPSSEDEFDVLLSETRCVHKLGLDVELRFLKYEEMRRKEKEELENSIVSLTEENRDIGNLLRIALVEKEAVEKSLNKLKGSGEQKRVAILQIAERGLQKVGFGFGFMMGSSTGESASDNPSSSSIITKSDGSEFEEGNSLASTVEKIMKNLRLEISGLKRSLEEARSDSEHLQSLADKQAKHINESTLYIKDLEERESMLAQNVEDLIIEVKETEEEASRWREACELEVEAGKAAIEECERVEAILREELERTEDALNAANKKLKIKEKLAATAMAAQAAAETSLRMADSRSVGLRERIEELTRQLDEEAECSRRERNGGRRRVRHVCWPWRALQINPSAASNGRSRNPSRRIPEMVALLQ